MYVEITKLAFDVLTNSNTVEDHGTNESELAIKNYYYVASIDTGLLEVYNHVSGVWQYYIRDVNA